MPTAVYVSTLELSQRTEDQWGICFSGRVGWVCWRPRGDRKTEPREACDGGCLCCSCPLPAPGLAPRELLAKAASLLPRAGRLRAQAAVTQPSWRTTPQASGDEARGQGPRGAHHSLGRTASAAGRKGRPPLRRVWGADLGMQEALAQPVLACPGPRCEPVLELEPVTGPQNIPRGWTPAWAGAQGEMTPSISQERVTTEHLPPLGTLGVQQRAKEAKVAPLRELTFWGETVPTAQWAQAGRQAVGLSQPEGAGRAVGCRGSLNSAQQGEGFPGGSEVTEFTHQARDVGPIPGLGRPPAG